LVSYAARRYGLRRWTFAPSRLTTMTPYGSSTGAPSATMEASWRGLVDALRGDDPAALGLLH
jgi:hypothetical protein